ncbi:MAG: pyrroline-5-carboxylate reductase [Chloroflexi bacterium]|nr:pyrroline-5-carboxylate reductase [Chloroflexota bacterium]
MKISFIGGGAMGEAILSAVLQKGLCKSDEVALSDISDERRRYIAEKYGVFVTGVNRQAAEKAEVVLFAIKPQSLSGVLPGLVGQLKPSQLVLSIIAGARIGTLRNGLKHARIVRVMPNTPAQIGEGMSVWTTTPEVTEQQKHWAASILAAMGREIYVDDEKYIDMATAVSGSGPAYVFLFIESLVAAAVNIGLSADVAHELVLQTLLGSGHLLRKSGKTPEELRKMVTSPGGTTAAALARFEKGNFSGLVKEAVIAAYNRAKELGGG